MRHRRNQKGSFLLEFSLCFVLVFTIILGIIEFSRVMYSRTVLAGATREAARYAIVHGSKSGSPATADTIRSKVLNWALGLDSSALVVNTTWAPSNNPESVVIIETSYTLTPMVPFVLGRSLTVGSRSEMVISQ